MFVKDKMLIVRRSSVPTLVENGFEFGKLLW